MTHLLAAEYGQAETSPRSPTVARDPGKATLTARLPARSSGEGTPLPSALRARFEASLGADLGHVRLHAGEASAQLVADAGARALAHGQDIHFGAGEYRPEDPFGLHLLAHEVAHTVQQAGRAPVVQYKAGASTDAKEQQADAAADAMVAGDPFGLGINPTAKSLPAPVMTRLRTEHATRRAKHTTALTSAETAGTAPELGAALRAVAPVFGIKLEATAPDLSGFVSSTAWGEAELRLHLDLLPPELSADAQVKAAKASAADILAACAELAAEYEPLFRKAAVAARALDLLQLRDAFIAPSGFGPILQDAFGGKAAVTVTELGRLFSARQRALLWDYLRSKRVPDGLFTGSPNGEIAPHQRILMAGHMMVEGTVEKREKDGEHTGVFHKGRADNCGHWAQMTWAYAAANPGKDFAGNGNLKKGSTGPTGEVAFGAGSAKDVYQGKEDASLPLEERHADHVKAHPEVAKTPMGKRRQFMHGELYETLQPGDWLHVYNANAAGEHSVIFSGWIDTVDQHVVDPEHGAITYRAARILHQFDNKAGLSAQHVYRLGFPFSLLHKVFPVTLVKRPSADAGPATTVAQLLPFTPATAEAANRATLTRHKLDAALLSAQVVTTTKALLAQHKALEPGQRALCEQVLADHAGTSLADLTMQLALGQRLLRESNVDGELTISAQGVPGPTSNTLLGNRALKDFRLP